MAIGLTGSLAVCLSHVRCSHMLLPLSCLLMPLFVSLVLARTLLFSPNATSLNAYATSLNAYSHTLAPISHPTPPQSRAKGKATISRGVEPADHKVSRRRVADCTGAREYLVEGTVVRMLPRRIQIQSQQPIAVASCAAQPIDKSFPFLF
jgi:hypothetical protein